ncbi:zinc-dependent metalloprotease [Flavobacterium sp. UBA7682]|uniref:zinc-dependent metalloprotease n=1 Tax=Flavobacterium sp. UBA7682 TaxID=1946560 RepID=UPI0025C3FE81|nr:zinc-dependent metalloprotease [Flavobacterium sp. UBA7682]
MNKIRLTFILSLAVLLSSGLSQAQDKSNRKKKNDKEAAAAKADSIKNKKPAKVSIADKIKTSKKTEGLFTIYQDTVTGSIQLFIKKNQLDKEFIYQSYSMNGPTMLGLNQSMHRATNIFNIKKANDKIEFGLVNTSFYYDKNNAVSKTAGTDIAEAIFLAEKIVAKDSTGYLIAADGLFLSEKLDPVKPIMPPGIPPGAVFNLGNFNAAKSKYHSVRSYPNNTDVLVDLAYDNPAPLNGGGEDITDARYVRVRIQHTFLEIPVNNFKSRRDDPRVGYFGQTINDQTSTKPTPYRDIIHRWYLTKKDPVAFLSEPVEPIVWWVENTTPLEYRETVVNAGNKWNEAFEKAGFKNAVVMKIQPDDADWDAGDVRYNVIRWVASANPPYGAIGPSFANPRTGQILGADITIEWASGSNSPALDELFSGPGSESNAHLDHYFHNDGTACTLANELKNQFLMGTTMAEAYGEDAATMLKVHEEFLYYLVLHEMGHTLGLNHNMKSSQMLSPADLHNKAITEKIGLIGSVMDYPAINLSLDRSKQGNYYTTKPGPYDLWAIEYGYKEFDENSEEEELAKILSRSTDPNLTFGNDADDMRSPGKAIDPRVMVNDLSSDAVGNAEERFKLVNNVMAKLKTKYSKTGQSYAELRSRYGMLNNQRRNMAAVVSRYVGGVFVDRSFVGQNTTQKPFTPVTEAQQKRAIDILNKYVFAPDAFDVDVQLYPYLQLQRRGFSFFSSTEDPKLSAIYQSIQTDATLGHILHPTTLQRVSNSSLYGNSYSVAEVMGDLTNGIFKADLVGKVNLHRQYLQTYFVKEVAKIADITDTRSRHDDISKAAARQTLKKIKLMLATASSLDESTRAHRNYITFLIENALTIK